MTRDQQVSFESSANQIAHETDECSDEPQFVHVPHLRAIDEKSPFACDATVDLVAQSSCPQVVRPEESLRVQDVSEDPASSLEHNTFVRIKHICCGTAIRLELSTNVVAAERERETNFQRRCKS